MDPYAFNRDLDEHNKQVDEEVDRLTWKFIPVILYCIGISILWNYGDKAFGSLVGICLCLPVLFINIKNIRG